MDTIFQIYHNGSVDFNNGSLSIAVFGANFPITVNAHIIYDHKNSTDPNHIKTQKLYTRIVGLLDAASVDDIQVKDIFVVTWKNYTYCETNVSHL